MSCNWPEEACACYMREQEKGDIMGRKWMHCEEGLSYTKSSMTRFIMYCLGNDVEIGDIWVFNKNYKGSAVIVSVKLRPDQFDDFEKETKGKLREPVTVKVYP